MNQTVEKRLDGASVGDWIRNNTNLLLMFALIVVGALTSDNFFSMDNILNVLRRITVNGMLAVACTMTLLVGGFDLSIGHVMALSAVLCIGFEKSTGSGAVGRNEENFFRRGVCGGSLNMAQKMGVFKCRMYQRSI